MKKLFLFSLFVCFSVCLFSQDIIITNENERIEAKILFVYDAVIKYSLFKDPENTAYLIATERIRTIIYEKGEVVTFEKPNNNSAEANNAVVPNPKVEQTKERIFKNIIRINPLESVFSAMAGVLAFDFQYARYLPQK